MRLARIAVHNPYWVVVLTLMTALLGGVCLSLLPKDILPTFKTSAVQVVTFYPGMPAEVMEKDITTRLERWTGQSNGIARQESKSMIGVSIVKDFFRPDIDPNTAMSQVTSFAMSDLFYLPPGTIPPMVMPFDPTAAVPLALITVQNPRMDESKLYDVAYFDLRNMLQGIPGVIAPAVYGGKLRRILAYVDPAKMAARDLSSLDVVQALRQSNVMIPTGDVKLGDKDVQVVTDALVPDVGRMNDFPIRAREGVEVRMKDVATVEDSHQIQTNIVRINGKRQVYIPIYRQPGANTIAVVDGIKKALSLILERLPQGMKLDVAADQSVFVRRAVESLSHELVLGGLLAALMVLLFLRSLRSSLAIFLAMPLSIFACFIGLYATGDTLNAMTLGGLALAVGRLIDDSIVVLENITRHIESGSTAREAALSAADEVAMPVLAATITTLIVFLPVFFLTGMGKFLFAPLARAVAFSIGASYVVAMTVVPAFCDKFLKARPPRRTASSDRRVLIERAIPAVERWLEPAVRFVRSSFGVPLPAPLASPELCAAVDSVAMLAPEPREWPLSYAGFVRGYRRLLARSLPRRGWIIAGAFGGLLLSLLLYPRIGKELFPAADVGHLTIHARMPTGTRIELSEAKAAQIERGLRDVLASDDLKLVIANIGVLNDWPAAYTPNSGPGDMFFEVEVGEGRRLSTQSCADALRAYFRKSFPDVEISIETGGMLTAALNMGLAAPIDIQVEGQDLKAAHEIARSIVDRVKGVPGAVDVGIQESVDYPQIAIELNRPKIARLGLTVDEVVKSVVTALNSSVNFAPAFWIDPKNGNHYFLGAQYREDEIRSLDALKAIGVTGSNQERTVRLGELADFRTTVAPSEIRHLDIKRVIDVFANVSGRDVGGVASDIARRLPKPQELPQGYRIRMRGEVSSMREAFANLGFGLLLAVALVYLVLAGQFRSFLDPLLILFAVPLGLTGVLAMLWATRTTFNIQSFMGVIFMVGIAVSNGILLVEFANRELARGKSPDEAVIEAAAVRLRPILMTSLATLLGLLPMAVGGGRGAQANAPLARAVIGGMMASTVLVLLLVPLLYNGLQRLKGPRGRSAATAALLLILFAAPKASAETASWALSYDDALAMALKDNPGLLAAAARVEQARAAVVAAQASYYPRLAASAIDSSGMGGSSSALGITGLVNSPYRKGEAAGLDAAWNVYDFGRTAYGAKAAREQLEAARADVEGLKLDVRAKAAEAYCRCAELQGLGALFERQGSDQAKIVGELEVYVRSGLRTPVELGLMKATLEGIGARRQEARALEAVAREDLAAVMGHSGSVSFSCVSDTAAPVVPAIDESSALSRRPELAAARRRAAAAQARWRAAGRERWPVLSAVASAGVLSETSLVPKQEWSAGVGLRLPLFEGLRLASEEKAAAQAARESEYRVAVEQQAATRDVRAAAAWAAGAREKRLRLDEEERTVEQAYLLARRRYLTKAGSFADLRDAQGMYFRIAEEDLGAGEAERLAVEQLKIAAGM